MKRRSILALVIVVVAAAITFAVLHKSSNVQLALSPSVANLRLDNVKTVRGPAFYATPGAHSLAASFPGFGSKTVTFTVTKGKSTKLTLVLPVTGVEGRQWLIDHPDEQKKLETIVSSGYGKSGAARAEANPIIKLLPYVGPGSTYRIDFDAPSDGQPDSAITLQITYYTATGKQEALEWITKEGYNPSSFKITYIDKTADYQPVNNPYTN